MSECDFRGHAQIKILLCEGGPFAQRVLFEIIRQVQLWLSLMPCENSDKVRMYRDVAFAYPQAVNTKRSMRVQKIFQRDKNMSDC